ncbi:3-hydroxyacyl-CoA dehydrogenase NAD-binding domain-containing protein [Sphingomonas sp. NIBR02145]|uniref:3-hydroxyacyl-CoA dehydrogenase NAD-binding domain-containing protein n=1 Tax=Sphingomonas sp. NIBR02145 TaxID=3014784 RepID=UPI0022B3DACC|nr:3-hydroxyacyl-CoA dehydrogenase NAD-binding domain-containing protein [Sphingomonas sp. NIBR02145]WHU04519.1 3-hydroxyacyl-CoA dehydrogenase NAD-binding domain-containing protein [Sphingomonas sp. NIBR02145]
MQVEVERRDKVALLRFSNPPVNTQSVAGVGVIAAAFAALVTDPAVAAIVVSGGPKIFSAGAQITEFDGDPSKIDANRAMIEAIEASPKPVVAAINGVCMGGGLELALACHYRVSAGNARIGLTEVTLGVLPGGGGTQRLPRLIGAKAGLELMLSGRVLDGAQAKAAGVVDDVVTGDAEAAALALAELVPAVRRTGEMPAPGDLAEALAAARPRSLAQRRIVECVAAIGTHDFVAGLRVEADLFSELLGSEESRGLRHAFFGRRIAARVPGLGEAKPGKIGQVAVIGGGLMGTGIALALLNAGLKIVLVEPRAEALDRARATIAKAILREVEKGRIGADVADARLAALTAASEIDAAAGADLLIEAVFEDMEVKRQVFEGMERVARTDAILASNTSTLDLDAIAGFTATPERVVGLHFFSPANVMKLLEVVRGAKTAPETLATAMAFGKAIGKSPVAVGVCDGFVGNRMFEEYLRQAWYLLEEGALPGQLDGALKRWGMAMGPVAVMDLAGQDIGWSIRKRRAVDQPDRPYSKIPDLVCELGRFGQKTGAGFYRYPDGRTAEPDPEIDALILAESARLGIERREIGDEEIVERCIYALVNEGAKILGERIAWRAVDIDVVYLDGYGFPGERGGPMYLADRIGLPRVLERIEQFAAGPQGWAWAPAPLLVELAASGRTFASLDAATL